MPKHHVEKELKELTGHPGPFIQLLIKSKAAREEALHTLGDGPAHKQLYSSLLLQRMHGLIKSVEHNTGKKFTAQDGIILVSDKEDIEIPIPLLLEDIEEPKQEAVAEVLAHAPAHEIIAFNSLLQGIEWCIASLEAKNL